MSRRRNRNLGWQGGQWQGDQINQILSQIDPNRLHDMYRQSVQQYGHLHHPSITAGTATEEYIRRDFNTWLAGVVVTLVETGAISGQQGGYRQPQQFDRPQGGGGPVSLFRSGGSGGGGSLLTMQVHYPPNIKQTLDMATQTFKRTA